MPFFSIIIPTYNRAHLIEDTIASVQSQTFTDWECIVVDDGSTDNTKQVIQEIIAKDERIRYVFQENAERSVARNNGIHHSQGDYICFLDSDDQYYPNHLEVLHDYIVKKEKTAGIFFTDLCQIEYGKENKTLSTPSIEKYQNPVHFVMAYAIIPPRVCVSKQIFEKYQFDDDIVNGEDSILWSKIVNEYAIYHIQEVTIEYFIHDENSINIKSDGAIKRLNGLRKYYSRYPSLVQKIPKKKWKRLISNTHFNISKHYIYHNKRRKALKHLFLSVFYQPNHIQNKHKLYLFFQLIAGNKVEEYS
jgi:glycosyltransferase involved in cell wall biosynthesis